MKNDRKESGRNEKKRNTPDIAETIEIMTASKAVKQGRIAGGKLEPKQCQSETCLPIPGEWGINLFLCVVYGSTPRKTLKTHQLKTMPTQTPPAKKGDRVTEKGMEI